MTIPDSLEFNFMMENGSIELPCKPQEEKKIVEELTAKAEADLREGNLYYVVSNRWFMTWKSYTDQVEDADSLDDNSVTHELVKSSKTVDRPGPIDNTDIITEGEDKDDDPQLNKSLVEGNDYLLVPEEVWEKLVKWYKGGPALRRKMIAVGDQYKQFCVEVFPLCLRIIDSRNQRDVMIKISKKASVYDLYEKVCGLTGLGQGQVCIWDFFDKEKHKILESSNQTLEDANIQMDQDILLEVSTDAFGVDSTGNGLALIPVEPTRSQLSIAGGPTTSNGSAAGYSSETYQRSNFSYMYGDIENGHNDLKPFGRGDRGGLAGLLNLGNTCFMNSALQCLVHTPHLAEYFLEDFTDEINKENPLGMRGELALAFGDLLRKLWSSGRGTVAPRVFKGKLGRFAPQFSGYNQHDSQELLAFLLDGLHEDLNRVKQKPYIETKDIDGRPDEEVADEFWRYHKARNDSVIVDICQGQYKSTLVCPSCEKISITFDPFMYLSLPLPSTATRLMTVTVFYGDGSHLPMPYTVKVLKQGCFKDLSKALGFECCLQSDEYLLLAEVYGHRIYRYLDNPSEELMTIKDDEHIVAYRLPKTGANSTRLEINHRVDVEKKPFLTPLLTILEDAESGEDIDLAVGRVLSCLRKKAFHLSSTSNTNGENGSALHSSEAEMNDIMESESASGSNDIEMEGISNEELSFNLSITDERNYPPRLLMKDTPINPKRPIKVFLDWTKKEHELYDANYLKDLPVVLKTGILPKKIKQEAISLFSCLDAYLKEEPLGPDDMWYCPKCKEHRQASKKLDLYRLPDVLVFHLKRFSYSRWMKNKLDTFVDFPINNLDLSLYVKSKDASEVGSHVYELFAISNHYGGLGGGHYSAYCKLIDENKWYHFDDSHVSQVGESEIRTSAAYVLFYKRVKSNSNCTDGESVEVNMDV